MAYGKPVSYEIKAHDDYSYELKVEISFDKKLFSTAILKAFSKFMIKEDPTSEDKYYYTDDSKLISYMDQYLDKIIKEIESDINKDKDKKINLIKHKILSIWVNPNKAKMRLLVSGYFINKNEN